MYHLIISEVSKLKRFRIFWMGITAVIFSALLAAFQMFGTNNPVVSYEGLSESVIWNNFSLVFPFTITLIGGYMINYEYVEKTLKNLLTIPISIPKIISAKLIVLGFITIGLSMLSFLSTFVIAVILHCDGINILSIIRSFGQIVGMGLCCFIAVLPIIIFFTKKANMFLAGVGFAFVYGFCGIFIAGRNLQDFYPITAGLRLVGYGGDELKKGTPYNMFIGLTILFVAILLSVLMIRGKSRYEDGAAKKRKQLSISPN